MGHASQIIIQFVKSVKINKSEGVMKNLQVRKHDGKGNLGNHDVNGF
jgi:hypothetical protein